MTFSDLKIGWHKDTGAQRFGYWISFIYNGPKQGKAARKSLIHFFEQTLGPMGVRWQYQKHNYQFILKLDSDKDFLLFLLKLK
jgi:hypothetical protein